MPCTTFINETHPCTGTDNCDNPDEISASLETSKCPMGATIVDDNDDNAYASWKPTNGVWDVSNCKKCKASSVNIDSAYCFGDATMLLATGSESINTVHTTRENIIFNDHRIH